MYYLYILKNVDGRHYIGISADIVKRLESHNSGKVKSTKPYRPWAIVYKEQYENRILAREREVELKSNFSKRDSIFKKV